MMATYLALAPWDLLDEGLAVVLDRLQGSIGVGGVTLSVALPPLTRLRLHDVQPRVIQSNGGLFFHPDEQCYSRTRCKPVALESLRSGDPLGSVRSACSDRDLAIRYVVSASGIGRLAARYPDLACKNVFNAVSQQSLCLSNPEVQAMLEGLAADLAANHDPQAVVLTDVWTGWREAHTTDLVPGRSLGPAEVALLSICFCESCKQQASAGGIDVAGAQRAAHAIVDTLLSEPMAPHEALPAKICDAPPLRSYLARRGEALTRVIDQMDTALGGRLLVQSSEAERVADTVSPVDLSVPSAVVARIDELDGWQRALAANARGHELCISEVCVRRSPGEALVKTVADAASNQMLTGVTFECYGGVDDQGLAALRRAIRFGRRTAAER